MAFLRKDLKCIEFMRVQMRARKNKNIKNEKFDKCRVDFHFGSL